TMRRAIHVRRALLTAFGAATLLGGGVLFLKAGFTSDPLPTRARTIPSPCPPRTDRDYFFPPQQFDHSDTRRDRFQRESLSRLLRAGDVPSLSCGHMVDEAYRFVWITEWGRSRIVTIMGEDGTFTLNDV